MASNLVPPGPSSLPLVGIIPKLAIDPLNTFQSLHLNYGGFVRFQKGRSFRYICFDPEGVHHVLATNGKNYTKSRSYQKLKTFLGAGLVTTEGSQWQQLRKNAQPGFSPPAMKDYFTTIKQVTEKSLQKIKTADGFDLSSFFIELTLSIISQTMFHLDLASQAEVLSPAFEFCVSFMNHRMESFIDWNSYFTTSRGHKFNQYKQQIDKLMLEVIAKRKLNRGLHRDYLESLLEEQNLNPTTLSDTIIKDQLITFVMAGHETSANMLSWTLLLLLQNKKQLKSATDFCRSIDIQEYSDLSKIDFIENILKESLRLYPPVWMISRDSVSNDSILGFAIVPKSTVNICPYVTHRSSKYWDNPLDFNPQRFELEYNKKAYFPFSSGARACIGSQLALMEGKWIVYQILKNFNLTCDHLDLSPQVSVVLKPKISHRIQCTKAL